MDCIRQLVGVSLDTVLAGTYVNGREPLLHVVGGKQVENRSELQQQVVLEAEDGPRPNDGCLGEDAPRDLLTPRLHNVLVCHRLRITGKAAANLGAVEFGRSIEAGAVARHVHVAVDIVLGDSVDNTLGTLNVNILQREVSESSLASITSEHCAPQPAGVLLGGVVAADQVIHNVGVADALLDRLGVAKIVFL